MRAYMFFLFVERCFLTWETKLSTRQSELSYRASPLHCRRIERSEIRPSDGGQTREDGPQELADKHASQFFRHQGSVLVTLLEKVARWISAAACTTGSDMCARFWHPSAPAAGCSHPSSCIRALRRTARPRCESIDSDTARRVSG
jgi:hypothetical protein